MFLVEAARRDERWVVVLHERLVRNVKEDAAAVGLRHVEELRATEGGENICGLTIENVLQRLSLVVGRVLDRLFDLDASLCSEVLDDVSQDVFVFRAPVEERDLV